MREFRSSGSVRGALGNGRPYRERRKNPELHPLGETRKSGTGHDVRSEGLICNGLRLRLLRGLDGASRERARPHSSVASERLPVVMGTLSGGKLASNSAGD